MWIWHKKKVGGKGFLDIDLGEIQELIVTTPEEFTDNDLMEMSASEPVPDDEEEDIEEAGQGGKLTLDGSDYSRLLLTSFTTWMIVLYDIGTGTKAKSGRKISTIEKYFERNEKAKKPDRN